MDPRTDFVDNVVPIIFCWNKSWWYYPSHVLMCPCLGFLEECCYRFSLPIMYFLQNLFIYCRFSRFKPYDRCTLSCMLLILFSKTRRHTPSWRATHFGVSSFTKIARDQSSSKLSTEYKHSGSIGFCVTVLSRDKFCQLPTQKWRGISIFCPYIWS